MRACVACRLSCVGRLELSAAVLPRKRVMRGAPLPQPVWAVPCLQVRRKPPFRLSFLLTFPFRVLTGVSVPTFPSVHHCSLLVSFSFSSMFERLILWSMYAYMTLCRLQRKCALYSTTSDWTQVGNYVSYCFFDRFAGGDGFTVPHKVGRVAVSTGENLGCGIWKERNRMAGEDDCQSADGRSPCHLCLLASEFQIGVCNLITMSCMRTMLPLRGTYSLSKAYCLNCHGSLQTGDNLYIPVPHAATCPKCLVK